MRSKPSIKPHPLKQLFAIAGIPAVLYLSGALVVYKVLALASVEPQWGDFSFFKTINQGLDFFTGGFLQSLWLVVVSLLVILAYRFMRQRFYAVILIIFVLFTGGVFITSGKVAAQKIATSAPVQFEFDAQSAVATSIREYNQKNEFRLLIMNTHDYIVLLQNSGESRQQAKGLRIPESEVGSLTIEVNHQ